MISAIGPTGTQRMADMIRTNGAKPNVATAQAAATGETVPSTPAALLAAEGAPIDSDKVASIKAALAAGTYAINPRAIADRMIALDLPGTAR
ncbi:flagellar biosynthesis anti-sigma factor FlgM [Sphingomonas sp. BIUV-7]|uniref:Negative regulator of flagellin synthesis n=2 Tax=Sphingomonas natans TaxID=3063330 RepID=A0ABT8YDY3_9SPHN|nr:flagellar biosynthesis anti-sigma factor FlgM [Sphingomonas sp. BIUV-7]MDO6416559.1 flagellar biosynthesis anti-sigma factor FlgM [Sphingomonas sp. BIUV-7]